MLVVMLKSFIGVRCALVFSSSSLFCKGVFSSLEKCEKLFFGKNVFHGKHLFHSSHYFSMKSGKKLFQKNYFSKEPNGRKILFQPENYFLGNLTPHPLMACFNFLGPKLLIAMHISGSRGRGL